MAYTASEQALYDHARQSLPRFLFQNEASPEELWGAYVKIFDASRTQTVEWLAMSYIKTATGVWLDQHARDRGTRRQASETDAALRVRLVNVQDSVTAPALLAGAQAITTAGGVPSPAVAIVELRRDKGFFQEEAPSGTGDALSGPVATAMTLTDAGGFFTQWQGLVGQTISIFAATTPANNGSFPITGATATTITYTNAAGVAEAFTGPWVITNGRKSAYLSRGYRMGDASRSTIIAILPFGTTAATRAAVDEYLRLNKGAGYKQLVEVRGIP